MTIAALQVQCVAVPGAVGRSAWGSSGTTGVDGKVYKSSFCTKVVTVSELVKNCRILSMLCSVVLWINSPGSIKICSVERNRFFMKVKGNMLRVTK